MKLQTGTRLGLYAVLEAPDEDCVISAELDRARMQDIRRRLPSLANRQPAAYRSPTGV